VWLHTYCPSAIATPYYVTHVLIVCYSYVVFCHADEVKYLLLGQGLLQEGVAAHIVSSITAGLAVATTTNPLDLVKSRYMNQEFDKVGDSSICMLLGC
jgi:hypothetical protein